MELNPNSLLVNPRVEWFRKMLQKVRRRKLGKQMEEEKQTKPSTPGISLTEEWIWWVKGENAIAEFPWVPLDEVGERWQCSA